MASLSDDELFDEIIAARVLSGYGVGLLYVDGAELLHAMERKGLNDLNPKWIEAVVVNHVLRYVRIDTRNPEKPVVIAQRHGRRMRRTITPGELYAAVLTAGKIPPLFNELFSVLGLPGGGTTAFQTAIKNPFYTLMLSDLAQQVGWDDLYEVVPGPEAEVVAVPAEQGSNEQVRTDCVIKGSAHLDLKTGKVEARAVCGLAPLTRYVPIVKSLTPVGLQWVASLPAFVPPGNPALFFAAAFKQLKDLGHQGGMLCVLLGILVVDLLRRDPRLLGSSFAASAREEFPFIYVLPESPEIKETTNSGKTTLAVAFLRIMEPAITAARIMTRNTSAPALRSAFVDLLMYGTSALDEFLMPMNPEHPLCKEAMQSLSTGGITSVGKVGETHPGVRLRRPLVISSKVYWDRMFPDMRNRSYVVIVGEINEQTTAPDYILRAITTGALSQAIAIGVRRFVHDHNLVELLKTHEFPRVAGDHRRWRMHYGVAILIAKLTNVDPAEVDAYLLKSQEFAAQHYEDAGQSGLVASLNVGVRFSIESAILEAKEVTLAQIIPEGYREDQISVATLLGVFGIGYQRADFGRYYGDVVLDLQTLLKDGPVTLGAITLMGLTKASSRGKGRRRAMMLKVSRVVPDNTGDRGGEGPGSI